MKNTPTVACILLKSAWQAVFRSFSRLSPLRSGSLRSALTALLLALLAVNGSHSVYAADEATTKKSIATLDRAELVIDIDTAFEVNGQSAIPDGLFGVTAYNGPELAGDERWRALLMDSGLRWVGMPGRPGWLLRPKRHRVSPPAGPTRRPVPRSWTAIAVDTTSLVA